MSGKPLASILTPLELAFDTKEVRMLCENHELAVHELGQEVAGTLLHRLADLRAAQSPLDLLVGSPKAHPDQPRNTTLSMGPGYNLVISANHTKAPLSKTGGLDWARVRRVKIIRIERAD